MRKKDKYRKAIIKIAMRGEEFGVSKTNDIPIDCRFIKCEDCRFYEGDCALGRKSWLNSKCEEPKRVFTEEQKNFIRTCDKIKFLARDSKGELFAYSVKPNRISILWMGDIAAYVPALTSIHFPQIKWEDEEPTSREEILGE